MTARIVVNILSPVGVATLGQLFVTGPVSDASVISKAGRDELVRADLADHAFGWAWLTEDGVRTASEWSRDDLRLRCEVRWVEKLRRS